MTGVRMPNSDAAAGRSPVLSVVIATRDDPAHLLPKFEALRRELDAVGGELLIVTGADRPNSAVPPGVHHRPGSSVFECRAAGLSIARADLVALTEDHCVHPPGWCARILRNFAAQPDLVFLGGATVNGSHHRLTDRMNYWMTFAPYAPVGLTAQHPCIAQWVVRTSAVGLPLAPGELEGAMLAKWGAVPGAIRVDPELVVTHIQTHGFWRTFAVHFHNGRACGGYSPRRGSAPLMDWTGALAWSWHDAVAHFHRVRLSFIKAGMPPLAQLRHLLLVMPLLLCHAAGELVGYRFGPGRSPQHLV